MEVFMLLGLIPGMLVVAAYLNRCQKIRTHSVQIMELESTVTWQAYQRPHVRYCEHQEDAGDPPAHEMHVCLGEHGALAIAMPPLYIQLRTHKRPDGLIDEIWMRKGEALAWVVWFRNGRCFSAQINAPFVDVKQDVSVRNQELLQSIYGFVIEKRKVAENEKQQSASAQPAAVSA